MKPLMIYAMPRTRSFATLHAAKRVNRYPEPFAVREILPRHAVLSVWQKLEIDFAAHIDVQQWQDLVQKMESPDSASKIFGIDIHYFKEARDWWLKAQESDLFDLYVLQRDRRELGTSFVLAWAFGFDYNRQTNKEPKRLPEREILHEFEALVTAHLRYFPQRGTLINYYDLPHDNFDNTNVDSVVHPQDNWSHAHLIENIGSINKGILRILDWYSDEWDAKERSLQA